MKRPLDLLFHTAIEPRAFTPPTHWAQRVECHLRSLMRLPRPVLAQTTPVPLMVFDNLPALMTKLDLSRLTPYLQENKIDLYPAETPPLDGSSHFAQWAIIWEPADETLFRKKTLNLAVGAGQRLLNLTFTPYIGRTGPDDYRFQMDDVALYDGHDLYNIPAGEPSSPSLARDAFDTAGTTIRHIHDDYPLAESTLISATSRLISALQPTATRAGVSRPAAIQNHNQIQRGP